MSLQTASTLSDASATLQRLSQVLFNIALRYVEVKAAAAASNTSDQNGREFDEYCTHWDWSQRLLLALGLALCTRRLKVIHL